MKNINNVLVRLRQMSFLNFHGLKPPNSHQGFLNNSFRVLGHVGIARENTLIFFINFFEKRVLRIGDEYVFASPLIE